MFFLLQIHLPAISLESKQKYFIIIPIFSNFGFIQYFQVLKPLQLHVYIYNVWNSRLVNLLIVNSFYILKGFLMVPKLFVYHADIMQGMVIKTCSHVRYGKVYQALVLPEFFYSLKILFETFKGILKISQFKMGHSLEIVQVEVALPQPVPFITYINNFLVHFMRKVAFYQMDINRHIIHGLFIRFHNAISL